MGLPQVNIQFQQLAASAIQRGNRGIICMLLKDTAGLGTYIIQSPTDIPSTISSANQNRIKNALIGNVTTPSKILIRVGNEANWNAGLTWAETVKFDLFVIPEIVAGDLSTVNPWVTTQRQNYKFFRFVSPQNAADKEYIYNFTAANITLKDNTTPTIGDYCARIAGIIAGTPLTQAITYVVLPEVASVESLSNTAAGTRIDNGEVILINDGEKVKIARGVTSLKTLTTSKGAPFQKIKIVEILDLISSDVRKTLEDNWIGDINNSYDNKVILCTVIKGYFESLESQGLLEKGKNFAEIDIKATKTYLTSIGIDISNLTDQQIKEYNTNDKVFLKLTVSPLDAMEDFTLNIYM
ncbi:phage tail sheath protein [Bacillus sp. RG28]|uniref:Phage tail sheath protein n=1 Tax=Gottfriedia endophytica TaxID=2820819 RepID=A0A940SJJ4_9BACI|nr:phage tail sheath C-terminal domain-containing protein [Gottfriedia endophytica]MBP0725536.1 phage tail sheath protein [Gottfriedia endophytica]